MARSGGAPFSFGLSEVGTTQHYQHCKIRGNGGNYHLELKLTKKQTQNIIIITPMLRPGQTDPTSSNFVESNIV